MSNKNKRLNKKVRSKYIAVGIIVMTLTLLPPVFALAETGGDTVTLGTDKTFWDADIGDCGKSKWGLVFPIYGSHYDTGNRKATAAVGLPPGLGGATAWAWVGKDFTVQGSGSQAATVRMVGHYYGTIMTAVAALAKVTIELIVKDMTTGGVWKTTIFTFTIGVIYCETWDEDFNDNLTVQFTAGCTYQVRLRVYCMATVGGIGGATSDFGPEDGDNGRDKVQYSYIRITF